MRPERDQNPRDSYKENWWIFAEARPGLRKMLAPLERYIVTPNTAKHRPFMFLNTSILPDTTVYAVASGDAFHLGVLSSQIHLAWARYAGGTLQDRPRYNSDRTFLPFPFPDTPDEPLKIRIRDYAEKLDVLRKEVLARHPDLTMTKLYNTLHSVRTAEFARAVVSERERDMAERGCISLIRQHHDAIDHAVAEAYGWPADLSDEEILHRVVALNKTRASEEAKGQIRWLCPQSQSPGAAAPQINATLDLGDAPAAAPQTVIPWPKTLAEQVSVVAAILASASAPQYPREVARAFSGKRAATITPVLDALTSIGHARRLADGRYAA